VGGPRIESIVGFEGQDAQAEPHSPPAAPLGSTRDSDQAGGRSGILRLAAREVKARWARRTWTSGAVGAVAIHSA
jgi:hypothetical protein